jgi:hypothetical protein
MTSIRSGEIQTEIDNLNRLEAALVTQRDGLLNKLEEARERSSLALIYGDENDPNAAAAAQKELADVENALNAIEDEIATVVGKREHAEQRLSSSDGYSPRIAGRIHC